MIRWGFICLAVIVLTLAGGLLGCAAPDEEEWHPDSGMPAGGPYPILTDPEDNEENVLVDKVIKVTFSDHLNARTLARSRIRLYSGPIEKWVLFYYDPVDRQLVTWPSSSMRSDLTWVFSLEYGVEGLDGSKVGSGPVVVFRTGDSSGDDMPFMKQSYNDDIQALFNKRCVSCHDGSEKAIAGLRLDSAESVRNSAIGVDSTGWPGWKIIVVSRPGESYLLYKLIGDDKIAGVQMPRRSDMEGPDTPLSHSELRAISNWIASDAPFFDAEESKE
jgi:hypothetical protein